MVQCRFSSSIRPFPSTFEQKCEVHVQVSLGVQLERLADHDESQIGSPDPDVDEGGDRLAGSALPLPRPDLLGEVPDAGEGVASFILLSDHEANPT